MMPGQRAHHGALPPEHPTRHSSRPHKQPKRGEDLISWDFIGSTDR